MELPASPPPFPELMRRVLSSPESASRVLSLASGPTVGDRYRHWDRLRRLRPPGSLTREEWWFALKYARMATRSLLPIEGPAGTRFSLVVCDPLMRMTSELDRELGLRLPLGDDIANPATRDEFIVSALIEEAIRSSQLEGASTTRRAADEMLRSGRTPTTLHERMIANNFRAMEYVRARRDATLDEDFLLGIHHTVTEGTLDDPGSAGRYRRIGDSVRVVDLASGEVLHEPPPANELEGRVSAMLAFANGAATSGYVHPIVRAVLLHFTLSWIHPFTDGNGRTARALFYWSMLHQGYGLAEFLSVSQVLRNSPSRYARAFQYTETDDGDATYIVLFHLQVIERAAAELRKYLARRRKEVDETRRLMRDSGAFNHRQLALLAHALRGGNSRYTFRSHSRSHHVVHQTARRDLLGLMEMGFLLREKAGREMVFRPKPGLEKLLKGFRVSTR